MLVAALVLVCAGFLLGPVTGADAHTVIKDMEPGPAESVSGTVDQVVLEFLDPVLPTPEVDVVGPGGQPVPGLGPAALSEDGMVVTVPFDPLTEPGRYQVDYRYVAADGDEQVGAYQFRYEGAADSDAVLPASVDDLRMFLHVLAATVWVGGQLTLAGLVPGLRSIDAEAPRLVARRFNRIAWPAFAVLVVTGIWNLFEVSLGARDSDYLGTLLAKLVLVALAGVSAAVHGAARSRLWLAVGGAVAFLASVGALFLGVQLGSH